MTSQNQYLSVYQFNKNMEHYFNKNPNFKKVYIKGEVSGIFTSSFGHSYFTLKDKHSEVPCVIYKRFRKNVDFKIKNGMKLLLIANVNVYVPKGKYQLDVRDAVEDGLGRLFVKYQQLKEKLSNEGLFKSDYKKAIPNFAKSVGVVSSREGSVIHDIIKTVNKQWPFCEIILFPSQVQGAAASKQLIKQIRLADSFDLDVLIIARGGGSIEDLWCFNDEDLVRTVFKTNTPIISAIGHESDVTLCDLVADKRASTPTMAANLAINSKDKISSQVSHFNVRLLNFMSSKLNNHRKEFEYMLSKNLFCDSSYIYSSKKSDFDNLASRFKYSSDEFLSSKRIMLNKITSSYVIRNPCKMQINSSKYKLSELHSRLIKAMDSIIKSNRHNLDKTAKDFEFLSDKFIQNRKFKLNSIKSSYAIQNPCRIQLNQLKLNLFSSKDNIVNLTNQKFQKSENDFINLKSRFNYSSVELITSKSNSLNKITSSYVIRNPCKMQLEKLQINLNNAKANLIDGTLLVIKTNKFNLDKIVNEFRFTSNKFISAQNFRLNNIKSSYVIQSPCKIQFDKSDALLTSKKEDIIRLFNQKVKTERNDFNNMLKNNLFKNPEIILNHKYDDLNQIKDNNIFKNPYLILDKYKNQLNTLKEKLDKQDEILKLKKEQQRQKSNYIKIIIVIVIILIIMLLLIVGGI